MARHAFKRVSLPPSAGRWAARSAPSPLRAPRSVRGSPRLSPKTPPYPPGFNLTCPALGRADAGKFDLSVNTLAVRLHIDHLPAYHAPGTRSLGHQAQRGQHPRGRDGREVLGDELEGEGEERVTRKQRKCVAVDLVVGEAAPAVVVVVHAGQVV